MTINVRDFGAKGDGTTNDASAFQSAINEAAIVSGLIIVPPSLSPYIIASTITLLPGVTLEGTGSGAGSPKPVIRFSGGDSTLLFFRGTAEAQGLNVTLRNLWLESATAATGIAIRVRNFTGLVLDTVLVTNFAIGLWADWGIGVYVGHGTFTLCGRAIQVGGNLTQTTTPVPGAGIRGGPGTDFLDTLQIVDSVFSQNVTDINDMGSSQSLGGTYVRGCTFFESSISPVVGKFVFVRVAHRKAFQFLNNWVESPNARQGVDFSSFDVDGNSRGPSYACVVRNNHFLFTTGTSGSQPVRIDRGQVVVADNVFECAASAVPVLLADNTSGSFVGYNSFLTYPDVEGFTGAVSVTADPNGGHAVLQSQHPFGVVLLTGPASNVTPDAPLANYFKIRVTSTGAFTINNPTNPHAGGEMTIHVENASGGVLGVITFGTQYRLAGAFIKPANGQVREITFRYDKLDGVQKWREVSRTAADQPV